jgi:hypothetical protein
MNYFDLKEIADSDFFFVTMALFAGWGLGEIENYIQDKNRGK